MSYITIYFGEKPVYLTDDVNHVLEERKILKDKEDTVYMEGTSNFDLQSMPKEIEKPQYNLGIIFNTDLNLLRDCFFSQFQIVEAGGGLVKNEKDELLMIFRNGKWDLPKGKLDAGETIEACAVREVEEETGLQNVQAGKKTNVTYHSYVENGTRILKNTHWYEMSADSQFPFVPQEAEGITEIKWVAAEDVLEYADKSYPAIAAMLVYAWQDR